MQVSKKLCDGCGESRGIWKNVMENGSRRRYCKKCWSCRRQKHKPTLQKKHLRPRSPKRAKQEKEYSNLRIQFLTENPMCQAHLPGCGQHATQVHHMEGRIGGLLLDVSKWKALCHTCHVWVENHPLEAKEKGLSGSRL